MASFERQLVEWLERRLPKKSTLLLGIGDDMAGVRSESETLWVTSDMLLDGVHFDSTRHSFESIGRKALACSLSDCAAMAVRPLAATVSLAWPQSRLIDDAMALYEGMIALANEFDVALAGGDTTSWTFPCAIDVTVVAQPYAGIAPVRRNGAKVGDYLYVTGPIGGSILGKHLSFTPRVAEARMLAEFWGNGLHAMMDISDGLALDLWRMCRASNVGAMLDESLLENAISSDARALAARGTRSALEHALSDGEDFELLLAANPSATNPPCALLKIGRVIQEGLKIERRGGGTEVLEPEGFLH